MVRNEKARFQRERAFLQMAGWTGLEPATFCVTGRRSNQLSYHPVIGKNDHFPESNRVGQEGILAAGERPPLPVVEMPD